MIRMVPPAKEGTSSTTSPPSTLRRAEDDDDMFSPTSAAALALSTLHHYGAHRDSRRPELRGTRLFNNTSNPSGTGHRTSPPYPTSQYHSYHDRRYHGDRYDRWSDRTREPSAHPPPASWVVPPYASRYPPHSQESTYSMEVGRQMPLDVVLLNQSPTNFFFRSCRARRIEVRHQQR